LPGYSHSDLDIVARLESVASPNSRRNYGKARDDLFALAGLFTPAIFME